jgi:hypothetical protein
MTPTQTPMMPPPPTRSPTWQITTPATPSPTSPPPRADYGDAAAHDAVADTDDAAAAAYYIIYVADYDAGDAIADIAAAQDGGDVYAHAHAHKPPPKPKLPTMPTGFRLPLKCITNAGALQRLG